jgi:murein DD-endopeptidase MepM/ murein hydrolase activator NlpD
VLGFPGEGVDEYDLMGLEDPLKRGLYRQLGWAVNQLSLGYYGWRNGMITQFYFPDGTVSRVPPTLNAGSVAIEYLFAQLYDSHGWRQATDLNEGLPALHKRMFGDPWQRSQAVEPLLPPGLSQPQLILPFMPRQIWSYTSGPHKAWETDGALAALDFAPPSVESGCLQSDIWIVAVADGLVVRSEHGAVVLDLDNERMDSNASFTTSDGMEQTGWAILYMHIEDRGRVARGTRLRTGDPIGHPSCEGGPASGTHMHIARKYNGEWVAAGGPIPFVMDGWLAHSGYKPFEGTLTRDGITVTANIFSPSYTFISREIEETTIPKRINLENRFRRRLCD